MIWYIKAVVVMMLFMRAIYTDVKKNIIENRLIGAGLVTGFLLSYLAGGIPAVLQAVKGSCGVIVVLFPLFLIRGLGAGDIKLLGVMAVFFPEEIINIVLLSFFAGAVLALGKMVVRGFQKQKIYHPKETLNFSIPIAIGTSMVMLAGRGV